MPLKRLESAIAKFVDAHLPSVPQVHKENKIIHEAIWGTHLYHEAELVFLDTPLLQRLRKIHQTGLSYFTFPTTIHTRFDHTLGTINICSRLIDELEKKNECKKLIKGLKPTIRLAALLHDCGHGTFSHTSEEIYSLLPEIQQLVKEDKDFKCNPAPHEMLSCLILKSTPFKDFFLKVNPGCDLSTIMKFIIGNETEKSKFKAEMLNSIFDGDKIDYIHRDAHFSGLSLKVDLDRLWYGVSIMDIPINKKTFRKLSISRTAAEPLEQIIFHRAMLSPTLYQHQKVRATDCMFKSIVEYMKNNNISVKIKGKLLSFQKPEDFLWCTDDDFWSIAENTKIEWLKKRVQDIAQRRLFHRTLTIANHTIDDKNFGLPKLFQYRTEGSIKAFDELRRIASRISGEANKKGIKLVPEDIWVDLPKSMRVGKDVEEAYVFSKVADTYEFTPAKDFFPVDRWAHQIGIHKWEGHVYCPEGYQESVSSIAAQVIEEEFGFTFKDSAFTECHVSPSKTC